VQRLATAPRYTLAVASLLGYPPGVLAATAVVRNAKTIKGAMQVLSGTPSLCRVRVPGPWLTIS